MDLTFWQGFAAWTAGGLFCLAAFALLVIAACGDGFGRWIRHMLCERRQYKLAKIRAKNGVTR